MPKGWWFNQIKFKSDNSDVLINKNIEILDLRIFLLIPPIFAYLPVYKDYNILGTESNDNIGPSNKSEDIKLVQFGRWQNSFDLNIKLEHFWRWQE